MFWKHKAEHLAQCRGWSRKDFPEGAAFRLALDDWVEITQTKRGWEGTEKNALEETVSGALGGLWAQGTCVRTPEEGQCGWDLMQS